MRMKIDNEIRLITKWDEHYLWIDWYKYYYDSIVMEYSFLDNSPCYKEVDEGVISLLYIRLAMNWFCVCMANTQLQSKPLISLKNIYQQILIKSKQSSFEIF